jgi:dTDP-4-dehydrorhamnose reductase
MGRKLEPPFVAWQHVWPNESFSVAQPSVVVNCAAISVPRECEQNPELADAVNVPQSIIQWLKSFSHNKPLLIHLSTDQG